MKRRILIFCEFYRPGFKSGGGMWTIANLVDRLGDYYEFQVISRNHDGALDRTPYREVTTGVWNEVGEHRAFYVDPSTFSKRQVEQLVNEVKPNLIFVNSVFGLTTRMLLEARRKGWIGSLPIVVAPCGELSEQCLAIKGLKKSAFLNYAKIFGLYRGVTWKATSELEAAEIREQFGNDQTIEIAPDLVPKAILPEFTIEMKPAKLSGSVRIVCVARLSPKKNIAYLLSRLSECKSGNFELELIGGVDDEDYWKECEKLIKTLPANVKVNFRGALGYKEVLARLVDSHYFVLPTLNENFGYVFVEAMAAGCPILTSENTIWGEVEIAGCGQVVALADPEKWTSALEELTAKDASAFSGKSKAARSFALNWLRSSGDLESNRRVFEIAMDSGNNGQAAGSVR